MISGGLGSGREEDAVARCFVKGWHTSVVGCRGSTLNTENKRPLMRRVEIGKSPSEVIWEEMLTLLPPLPSSQLPERREASWANNTL